MPSLDKIALVSAMNAPRDGKPPRVFELTAKEVPGAKIGSTVKCEIVGKVQSMHDDGRIFVKVDSVMSEDAEEKAEAKTEAKPMSVRTQESHA